MNIENDLLTNLDKMHTTDLGVLRIKKNLQITTQFWRNFNVNLKNVYLMK
ncbi:DUF3781 domain-containing protein [Clostridium botulinum]|nr:DUF3781 domain-containing protein [Clostridium botulinum]